MDVHSVLYEIWIGPRIDLAVGSRVRFHVTPCVSLNFVDAHVDRTETFTLTYSDGQTAQLNRWDTSERETQWVPGAGVAAGVDVEIGRGWFAGAQGGYDWLADDLDVSVGANTVSVDASGYSIGGAVGKRF